MKLSKTEFNELIKLQKLYRQGKIKEEEIPEDKLEALEDLYLKQIEFLKKSILQDKKKILEIKNSIN